MAAVARAFCVNRVGIEDALVNGVRPPQAAGPAAPAFRQSNRLTNTGLPQGCRDGLRTSLSCRTVFFLLRPVEDAEKHIDLD